MIIVADTSALFAASMPTGSSTPRAVEVIESEVPVITAGPDGIGSPRAPGPRFSRRDASHGSAHGPHDRRAATARGKHVDFAAAQTIRAKYEALRLDLADAVGVVLADKFRTDAVFTLDQRDFRAIEPLTPGIPAFRILPPTSEHLTAWTGADERL
ncbi:VapC toxin family PIN domain ribonuclease [Nocardia sp. NPDC058519]|uniref:VapC toxin family PIN domain ribonuclease n=1 Tax=Nocardia sp. NPDC058519 TaxID=3346535 RepID=UPI0036663647